MEHAVHRGVEQQRREHHRGHETEQFALRFGGFLLLIRRALLRLRDRGLVTGLADGVDHLPAGQLFRYHSEGQAVGGEVHIDIGSAVELPDRLFNVGGAARAVHPLDVEVDFDRLRTGAFRQRGFKTRRADGVDHLLLRQFGRIGVERQAVCGEIHVDLGSAFELFDRLFNIGGAARAVHPLYIESPFFHIVSTPLAALFLIERTIIRFVEKANRNRLKAIGSGWGMGTPAPSIGC